MKLSNLAVAAAALTVLGTGSGQAVGAPAKGPSPQLTPATCVMSADAVEAWTARGARLPFCVRQRHAQRSQDAFCMSADAVEAWSARGARLPACVDAPVVLHDTSGSL